MGAFFDRLRLKWFLTTRSLNHGVDFAETLYRIYLNHSKVIHYRRGRPVYSLSTPALLSKPAANFISRALFKTIQNRSLPNLMSFAVNDSCDAACAHCSFFEGVEERGRSVLDLDQGRKLIADAQELGVSVINFVGGEPLLREDLPDLIRSVNKDLSTTVLFTNGSKLAERAEELWAAGLDSVYVSIDASSAEAHDAFRKSPGLFDKAIQGIKRARKVGFSTGFSVTITPESWKAGELEKIVELAKEVGVHEVFVFTALPTGRFKDREDIVDADDWAEEMIRSAVPYNQDPSLPGVAFFSYMTSYRSAGCSCGTSYFYASPYGDIMSCDFNHAKFGNILNEPLWQVWERLSSHPEFCQAKWGGCKIQDSESRNSEDISAGPTDCSACSSNRKKELVTS